MSRMHEKVTMAICTYNRASMLPALVDAIRKQECSITFDTLFINNNSTDNTEEILRNVAIAQGPDIRYVNEKQQGIVFARNRAIEECRDSEYLLFIDDDEIPRPGILQAAVDALQAGYDCVGGRVTVKLPDNKRPGWLKDNLLGFLAEVDYGDKEFQIKDASTPVWTANIAYRTALFDDGLKFSLRYNRQGKGVGGGSDLVMFNELLKRKVKMMYCPDMIVDHYVEPWRLKRSYFIKLHFTSGFKSGKWELEEFDKTLFGVPPFLFSQAAKHLLKTAVMYLSLRPNRLRQAMNSAHALGLIAGQYSRSKEK